MREREQHQQAEKARLDREQLTEMRSLEQERLRIQAEEHRRRLAEVTLYLFVNERLLLVEKLRVSSFIPLSLNNFSSLASDIVPNCDRNFIT